ncbi:MAG: preprotein translocase subunit SecA [Chitinophagales bacterium]|nr:preprotein translocase subunit SecA [Bacteroidota bacterium]MCB9043183.1 preprotein translocase subunit SecA [Chitinophagales bacterium]
MQLNIFNNLLGKVFGDKKQRDLKELTPYVTAVNKAYSQLQSLSNDALRQKTQEFKQHIQNELQNLNQQIDTLNTEAAAVDIEPEEKEKRYTQIDKLTKERLALLEKVLLNILPEAFAVVKETARRFKENPQMRATATELDRNLSVEKDHISIEGNQVIYQNAWMAAGNLITWDMLHYDVQIVGGVVLHQGKIAEMATGEGKTLVATLPAYLNALAGEGVHIVTVNDYLARRDSEWMGGIFNFLGLTVDCIDRHQPNTAARRNAYLADITYGTNNEYGFDYLRDNMSRLPEELVQRSHHYAMVDEVDSVLVDDARTPLIISGPVEKGDRQEFDSLKPRIERLLEAQRKVVMQALADAKRLIAEGKTDENTGGKLLYRAQRGLPKNKALIKFLNEQGMKVIMQKSENYYMQEQNKNMHIIDEDLYFYIDEKNNTIELTEKGIDLITQTGEDSNFFVLPDIGSEMAEIEKNYLIEEEKQAKKDQLLNEYAIKSERIHSIQQLLKAYALFERDVEYVVLDGKVKIVDEQTGRIMEGRRYSDGLHQAIEAKENVKVEAATQTFATVSLQNYFRMYHKLSGMTGTAETEAGEFWDIYKLDVVIIPTNRPIQRDDRDDLVYRTKKDKYNAVIDEIEKLRAAGRPVLVGTTSVEVSELLSRMLTLKNIPHNVLNAKQHAREAEVVAEAGKSGTVTIATNMAGRGTDIKLGTGVREAGGLAIIGTERHDSRRVDRQLRGRAGRQGDPGSSQFYVALDDNLMRLFGSERIAGVMDRMGYNEGEVIQHSMITKSIERAQKKVEENNFGMRKRLLEYDDVMNSQRQIIYKRRRNALLGKRLSFDLYNSFYDLAENIVSEHKAANDYEGFKLAVIRSFALNTNISPQQFDSESIENLSHELYHQAVALYKRKNKAILDMVWPFIDNVYRERGETVENVVFPFTDGTKTLRVITNLKDCYNSHGNTLINAMEKSISLALIDNNWKEHLRQMDDLKQSVQLAVHEQKDPLLIYKFEAFELFKAMITEINQEVASFLFRANLAVEQSQAAQNVKPQGTDMSRMKTSHSDADNSGMQGAREASARQSAEQQVKEPIRVGPKIGRNDPCPCGSGKKYKNCHGRN